MPELTPTRATYEAFQHAYDRFNAGLFESRLPHCLITMQRGRRCYGYFSGARWGNAAGGVTDEIALNPTHFRTRTPEQVLSTLAHEMVHLWQHHFGSPSRRSYHNAEWAAGMLAIGLVPSDTGQPGGRITGQRMSHFVEPGGRFASACRDLLAQGFVIEWMDRAASPGESSERSGKRTKYVCGRCRLAAWAKPGAMLKCGACDLPMYG